MGTGGTGAKCDRVYSAKTLWEFSKNLHESNPPRSVDQRPVEYGRVFLDISGAASVFVAIFTGRCSNIAVE